MLTGGCWSLVDQCLLLPFCDIVFELFRRKAIVRSVHSPPAWHGEAESYPQSFAPFRTYSQTRDLVAKTRDIVLPGDAIMMKIDVKDYFMSGTHKLLVGGGWVTLGQSWAILGPPGAILGLAWTILEPPSGHLSSESMQGEIPLKECMHHAPPWGHRGPSRGNLGRPWGGSWGQAWAILWLYWAISGPSGGHLGSILGASWGLLRQSALGKKST